MATPFNDISRRNAAPDIVTNTGRRWWAPEQVSSVVSYSFYGAVIMMVLFVFLLIINSTVYPVFSFSKGDPGIISVPTPSDKQSAFTKSPAGNDMSGAFSNIVPCGYTIAMDLYLPGNFVEQTTPRILLYNASKELKTPITRDTLVTDFPEANLIVWLDPTLNDLYASVITIDPSTKKPLLQTSSPIVNVPLKSPFRVTYVYNQNFLEVYANGYMETSMSFVNKPRGLASAPPFFFGHLSSRLSSMVGNVNYWPRELSSREVKANGSPQSTVAFFNMPPVK